MSGSERPVHRRVRSQWAGVIVTAAGLAVIAVTGESHTSALRHYSLAALIAVECGVFALGAALIRISMHGSLGAAVQGLLLGVAAGMRSACPTSP